VSEPDSLLTELLAETTERLCGFKPDFADVEDFIKQNQDQLVLMPLDEKPVTSVKQSEFKSGVRTRLPKPTDVVRLTQDDLIPHIIRVLKQHNGAAPKETVEEEVYARLKDVFEHTWYHETVSYDIPRWKHNLAWAKERAKKRGLIKWPQDSGRGMWALTVEGLKYQC